MHWHEDLQFIYVLFGEIEVDGLEAHAVLNAGEGAFINKNVVHLGRKIDFCRNNSFIFHYIARHRGKPLTLNFIAESAHVSKSECLRCFKASLRTAPYQYPTEYRLSRAAEFLHTTDKTRRES